MDKDDKLRLAEIHAMVKTLSVDLQFLRRHRNVLFGTPVLEFNEVCSVLHLSARQVHAPSVSAKNSSGSTWGAGACTFRRRSMTTSPVWREKTSNIPNSQWNSDYGSTEQSQ